MDLNSIVSDQQDADADAARATVARGAEGVNPPRCGQVGGASVIFFGTSLFAGREVRGQRSEVRILRRALPDLSFAVSTSYDA